jgi:hypothetical protein
MSEPEELGAVLARVLLRQVPAARGDLAYAWTDAEVRRVRGLLSGYLDELETFQRWSQLYPELRGFV